MKRLLAIGFFLCAPLAFAAPQINVGVVYDYLDADKSTYLKRIFNGGDSSARAEVWQRQARFEELARQLEGVTGKLVAASSNKPLNAAQLQAPTDKVEAACKACHTEFRNH